MKRVGWCLVSVASLVAYGCVGDLPAESGTPPSELASGGSAGAGGTGEAGPGGAAGAGGSSGKGNGGSLGGTGGNGGSGGDAGSGGSSPGGAAQGGAGNGGAAAGQGGAGPAGAGGVGAGGSNQGGAGPQGGSGGASGGAPSAFGTTVAKSIAPNDVDACGFCVDTMGGDIIDSTGFVYQCANVATGCQFDPDCAPVLSCMTTKVASSSEPAGCWLAGCAGANESAPTLYECVAARCSVACNGFSIPGAMDPSCSKGGAGGSG